MRLILTVLLTFILAVVVFALMSGDEATRAEPRIVDVEALAPGASTDERIAALQEEARAAPAGKRPLAQLGLEYLQKVRETGDVGFYARAEKALLGANPRDASAVVGLGSLALARHEFRDALDAGRRGQRLQPSAVAPYPVLVDALIELGRYEEAGRALQRFVDRKPGLASYARVSYFRELHGDLDGAVEAMRFAISSGGGAVEATASVQALLGNLELARGRVSAARRAFRAARVAVPGHPAATAGLARVDVANGRLDPAIRRLSALVARLPLLEYVVALGETQLADGRRRPARDSFELVEVQQRLLGGQGVNTDVELAIFEADHGDPRRGVSLARQAWRAAPSVRSADALGWALTKAGRFAEGDRFARRALSLGWRDPMVRYHAALAARAAGRDRAARRLLRDLLSRTPRFSALHAPRARRALEGLR